MVLTPKRRGALVFSGLVLAAFCLHAALYAPPEIDVGQSPTTQTVSPSLDGIALAALDAAAVSGPAHPMPGVVAHTGYFGCFHLAAQWFPKIAVLELPGERGATAPSWNAHEIHLHSDFYADYGNFDVKITVPAD